MASYLGYPFDPELFSYNWANEKDSTLTAIVDSGAMVNNAEIARMIANGSDYYTVPFYKVIGGTPENYDGATDITLTTPGAASQSGIVYGRAHGWKSQDFIVDYNSGADPMKQISSQVAKYWAKNRQKALLGVLSGVFGVTGSGDFADWENHKYDISASGSTVADENKIGETTINDAIVNAVGDASGEFSLAIMHSKVAANLAGKQLLNFWKYTDSQGIERRLNIADINGLTVIIDDGAGATTGTNPVYTTYLLGAGALQYASAPVKTPVEVLRNATEDGGYDALITRVRETVHPNGFSYSKPASGYTASPTDAQLSAADNWAIVANPKNIAMAKILSNG